MKRCPFISITDSSNLAETLPFETVCSCPYADRSLGCKSQTYNGNAAKMTCQLQEADGKDPASGFRMTMRPAAPSPRYFHMHEGAWGWVRRWEGTPLPSLG